MILPIEAMQQQQQPLSQTSCCVATSIFASAAREAKREREPPRPTHPPTHATDFSLYNAAPPRSLYAYLALK